MKKRLCAVLTAAVLLLTAIPVSGLAEQERFSNAQDLMSYLFYDCTYMLIDEIELAYTQALDDFFDGGFNSDILANCGIIHKGVSWDQKRRQMTISDIEYYPGFKAAQAWEMGITDILNEDERTMLARAEAMVEEARMYAQSPYQVLINLHNALVKRTVYTPSGSKDRSEWNYRDTAVGALVYGEADCDGYADAFYLLGTLAGFQVRLISGDAINEDGEYGGHAWNLIWWEDGWYHVDVTWDDVDFPEDAAMMSYQYLLAGSSMLTKHLWKEEYLVNRPQKYTNWDQYYYTCDKSGISYGAYYNTLEDAANYAVYMQRNYDRDMIHVMIDGDYENQADRVIDQLLKSGLNGMFYTWVKESGGYSFISIYK